MEDAPAPSPRHDRSSLDATTRLNRPPRRIVRRSANRFTARSPAAEHSPLDPGGRSLPPGGEEGKREGKPTHNLTSCVLRCLLLTPAHVPHAFRPPQAGRKASTRTRTTLLRRRVGQKAPATDGGSSPQAGRAAARSRSRPCDEEEDDAAGPWPQQQQQHGRRLARRPRGPDGDDSSSRRAGACVRACQASQSPFPQKQGVSAF